MKKTIIAASIAAVVAAPAAFAEVTIGGKAHVAWHSTNDGTTDTTNVADNVSRIVIKSSDDLGNGMKAGMKFEDKVNLVTGDAAIDDGRENYVFLSGDFGQVRAGRIYGPAKVLFSKAEKAGDTAIDISTLSGSEEKTADSTIEYQSPNFNGVSIRAAFSGGGDNNTETGDDTDMSITYSANGLTVGYAAYNDDSDGTEDQTVVHASYKLGDISFGVSKMETDETTSGDTKEALAASFTYAMDANTLILQYGEKKAAVTGTTTDGWGAALSHAMSKNTSVYIGMRDSDVASDTDTAYALGMVHNF